MRLPRQRFYGGIAGITYDVCNHQACDTIGNVKQRVPEMADAIAHAVITYAFDTPFG